MKQKFTSRISLILFLAFSSIIKAQTLVPYLQSCTPRSIYITWKTDSNAQSLVQYGTKPDSLPTTIKGTTQTLSDVGYPANFIYHAVNLKNLEPNTTYYYKVTTGSNTSAVSSFKTLPLPGNAATADGHIRFLIMGDNETDDPKYDSLMSKAKQKCAQKFAGPINQTISGILMLGDQVNDGTLAQYEKVHFGRSKVLSPVLPIQTAVGENEVAGSLGLTAYNNLFYYDSLNYKGILSNTENYYAYQAGNVLIINLSTEHTGSAQFTWLQQIFEAANADPSVQWIISLGHRPYQAEQYVGDISPWIRNSVVPYLSSSPKYLMHAGGHHHLYARGQLKDKPVYHVISGGVADDQYWTYSQEEDMEDVQKTLTNWVYNIVDIDVTNGKADVETYSIGSAYVGKNKNVLIDQFHRYKNKQAPLKPSITSAFGDSLQLPFTVTGSAFSSPAGELLNTTEFEISTSKTFSTIEKSYYRDYEDWFGYVSRLDSTVDVNAGVNILNLDLKKWSIPNGKHYVRVRYRDRNLEWSPWSAIDSFKVVKSVGGPTTLATNKKSYELTDSVKAVYANGPGEANDWIGLFALGSIPGPTTIVDSAKATGSNGFIYFKNIANAGQYFVAYFTNGTYTELAPRVTIFVGSIPVITTNKTKYTVGDTVLVNYTHEPHLTDDWVGVYKVGSSLNGIDPKNWKYVADLNGQLKVADLGKGYYFAAYFLENSYNEAGERAYFTIDEKVTDDTITSLVLNKSIYKLGEAIQATWADAPAFPKDELIMYTAGSTPGVSTPIGTKKYTNATANGTTALSGTAIPNKPGEYFVSMYTNDVFNEISNRVPFTIIDTVITSTITQPAINQNIKIYPNPVSKTGIALIESEQVINKVEFIDIMGRILFSKEQIDAKSYPLTYLNVPTGIYYVRVYQEDQKVKIGKIVVE
ncbi:MAG TPA: fibronectin type III domain-containing protein [Bacteroidia bacterium]|nr:fibronectin type III domain-containing protein [Bacteroidia bacterium]